jgi:hypothetical protein
LALLGFEKEDRRKRLYFCAIAILLAGLACSALLYYKASVECSKRLAAYESGAGELLPSPDNSKQYVRELELYGGTANVLAYRLRAWLGGLWRGKRLAYTIFVITVLVSWGIFQVARRLE